VRDRAYRLTDLELASRLSFFLWSSIPDDELIAAAGAGRLSQPAVLERQVSRMLRDPRSGSARQQLRQQCCICATARDARPTASSIRMGRRAAQSLKQEAELFFDSIIREDRNILDLLDADYTFVNERLARQYGIPNVYGARFRRVTLRRSSTTAGACSARGVSSRSRGRRTSAPRR
jgi:hypothetical protein